MAQTVDISVERKTTLMCEPHLMAFTHILKHEAATDDREGKGVIACTDGETVWYGSRYLALRPSSRAFVFVHELMHGIFRHGDRAILVRIQRGRLFHSLWNYAGDAIINEGIISNPAMPSGMFTFPDEIGGVRMALIHQSVQEVMKVAKWTPPPSYDPAALHGQQIETIYDWLVGAYDAMQHFRKERGEKSDYGMAGAGEPSPDQGADENPKNDEKQQSDEQGGSKEGERPGASDTAPENPEEGLKADEPQKDKDEVKPLPETEVEKMAARPAWDLEEAVGKIRELMDQGLSLDEIAEQANARLGAAAAAIQQIVQGLKMAGTGKGSMLLEMAKDLPKPFIPWNQLLRKAIVAGLASRMDDSYTRHGVPTVTALARGAKDVPYSPGITIFSPRPKILVILDVSGSMWDQLSRCFSEIMSIARQKNAIVELLTFDDGVQNITAVSNLADLRRALAKGMSGGGGTSLKGVWDKVATMRDPYRLAVVMTDGYIHHGEPPKIPVIWMLTPGGTEKNLPGTIVRLPALGKIPQAA